MSAAKQVIAINESKAARLDERQIELAPGFASASSESTRAVRRRLPDERRAVTYHFSIAGQEGYLRVGVYEDESPGEIFVRMTKEGSTVSGLMDAFATVVSLALHMAGRSAFFAGSSATCVLSPAAGPEIPRSAMPNL